MPDEERCNVIIHYINRYYTFFDRSPNFKNMQGEIKLSDESLRACLRHLIDTGKVWYDENRCFVTEFVREYIEAGCPKDDRFPRLTCFNTIQDHTLYKMKLPKELTGEKDYYLARERYDTMKNIGIREEDIILVEKRQTVKPGEIAAFYFNHSRLTIDKLQRKRDELWFVPENDEMFPLKVKYHQRRVLKIEGAVKMSIKSLL